MEQGMRTGDHFMRPQTQHQGRRPDNQTAAQHHHHHQPPPPQKCPRCDSSNTKFCYYNNYSLSQPRYFCKACRRYWTHGGTLRNVPVGGGCRKSKRPKPSTPSSSTAGQVSRNQSFSAPQNLTGTNPGQPLIRAPIMPSMGNNNSFYTGPGVFLSSLAAMQSLPAGAATANYGGGNGQYDANMTILQNLQSLRPHHHQAQNDHQIFPSQQSLNVNPARPLGSWTQSFVRGPAASSSASAGPSSGFWSRAAANGENQANSSSFNPNDWPDNSNNNNPAGFDPSG